MSCLKEIEKGCRSYLSGFQEISSYKTNDKRTNALACVKIFSYFFLVSVLFAGVVWGASSLAGRIFCEDPEDATAAKTDRAASGVIRDEQTIKDIRDFLKENDIPKIDKLPSKLAEEGDEPTEIIPGLFIGRASDLEKPHGFQIIIAHTTKQGDEQGDRILYYFPRARYWGLEGNPNFLRVLQHIEAARKEGKMIFIHGEEEEQKTPYLHDICAPVIVAKYLIALGLNYEEACRYIAFKRPSIDIYGLSDNLKNSYQIESDRQQLKTLRAQA